MLIAYLAKVPGHRVYMPDDSREQWLAYYVNSVSYTPEQKHNYSTTPAYTDIHLRWTEMRGRRQKTITFERADMFGKNVGEILAREGVYAETTRLRGTYEDELARFDEYTGKVGMQLLARGVGTDDLDGNPGGRRDSWYWSRKNTLQMVRGGQPTRVVADVFFEEEKTDRELHERDAGINTTFWQHAGKNHLQGDDEGSEGDDAEVEPDNPEIPIHPYVPVFDMQKHLRLLVHVDHLTPYVYDESLGEKLVLKDDLKGLVRMLLEHKQGGGFRDIVRGKGGGVVVLLAGPPGVGKTLTAEVYAEAEKRPLYSVQCSQLGTEPAVLEDELLKVFARANRWNAILLLDEADVYVHERGRDMQQNAIVGVFLRVLEYQDTVLFLTTNRPEDVDDAIASRCVARLNYEVPGPAEQRRIWEVLAEGSEIDLPKRELTAIVERNPRLSGRDVKNLLKLASLLRPGKPVRAEDVAFAQRFQPTIGRPKDG
jgi:hypothetical protein